MDLPVRLTSPPLTSDKAWLLSWRRADWCDTSATFSTVSSAIKVSTWKMKRLLVVSVSASVLPPLSASSISLLRMSSFLSLWSWRTTSGRFPLIGEQTGDRTHSLLSNCCQGQVHPCGRREHPGVTSITPVIPAAAKDSLSLIWENNPAHNPHWPDGCRSKMKCF